MKLGKYARGPAPQIHSARLALEVTHAADLAEHNVIDLAYRRRQVEYRRDLHARHGT